MNLKYKIDLFETSFALQIVDTYTFYLPTKPASCLRAMLACSGTLSNPEPNTIDPLYMTQITQTVLYGNADRFYVENALYLY